MRLIIRRALEEIVADSNKVLPLYIKSKHFDPHPVLTNGAAETKHPYNLKLCNLTGKAQYSLENMQGLGNVQISHVQAATASEENQKITLDVFGEIIPTTLFVDLLGDIKADVLYPLALTI
jgi:hypothetical protein